MAYTPLRVSIPEPCHEDWDGMHPVAGSTARHCDSCAKNVVDFTGWTDAQMHAYVKNNNGQLCGRFRPDQLGRPLRATHSPSYRPLKVAAAAAGLLLSTGSLEAQHDQSWTVGRIAVRPTPVDTIPADTLPEPPPMIMGEIAPVELPLPEAEPTDSAGLGCEEYPNPEPLHGQPLMDTIEVAPDDSEFLMGIVYIEVPRATGIDAVKDTLRQFGRSSNPAPSPEPNHPPRYPPERPETTSYLENVSISPNPARERLRLRLEAPAAEDLTVTIVDAAGRPLSTRPWRVETGDNTIHVERPGYRRNGIVFVRLSGEGGISVTKPVVLK